MDDEATNDVLEQILQKCRAFEQAGSKQTLKKRDLYTEGMDIFYRKPDKIIEMLHISCIQSSKHSLLIKMKIK